MKPIRQFFLCICYISFLHCCLACISENDEAEEGYTELKEGDRLPFFSVTMNNGDTLTTDDLQGECSVIVFFHTECPDCQKEFPILQHLYEKQPHPIKMVCISRREGKESIESYWEKHGMTLPFSAQESAKIYHLFAQSVVPRVYVADSNCIIQAIYTDNPIATYDDLCQSIELAVK